MDWELTKENCVPVRQGRSKAALEEMADPALDMLEAKRRELWSAITEYKGDDPLEPWQRFIKWMQEYGVGGGKADLMKVLEACTRELRKYPRYTNDIRFLRIWIQYADCLPDPDDVFMFLKEKGIGRDFALYYEAYATHFELKGNFQAADAVYLDGIQRGVKQLERLKQKHTAFQQRMAQRIQRRIRDEHVMGPPPEEPVRASLVSIRPRGSGRGHQGQQQQQQNAVGIFGVAGAPQQPVGLLGLQPNPLQQERGRRPIIRLREDDEFAGSENPSPGPLGYSVMPQVDNVRELQPYGVRRKENLDRALAWSHAPLFPGVATTAAGPPVDAPIGVEIFTDEEFQDGDDGLPAKAGRSGQVQHGCPSASASQSLDQSLMLPETKRSAPGTVSGGADALILSLAPQRTLLPRPMQSAAESFASLSLSGSSAAVPQHAPLAALSALPGRLTQAPDGAAFSRASHVITPGAMPVGAGAPAPALAAELEEAECVQQSGNGEEEMSYEERRAVVWFRRNPASRHNALPVASVGKPAVVGSISMDHGAQLAAAEHRDDGLPNQRTVLLNGSNDAENGDGTGVSYNTGNADVVGTAPRCAPFGPVIPTVETTAGTRLQTLQGASSSVQAHESRQGAPNGHQQRRPLADAMPVARAPLDPPASSLTCPGPPTVRPVGIQEEPQPQSASCVNTRARGDDSNHDDAQPTVTISTRGAFDLINSLFSEDLPHQQLRADRGPPRPSNVLAPQPPSLAPVDAIRPPCPQPQVAQSSPSSAPKQPPATEPTVTLHTKQAFDALNDMFCDTLPHEEARKLARRGTAASASNSGFRNGATYLKPISTSDVCRLANAARSSTAGAQGAGPRGPPCGEAGDGSYGRAFNGSFEPNPVMARPFAEAAPGLLIHEDTFLGPAQPFFSGGTLGGSAGVGARAASGQGHAQDVAKHPEPAAIYEDTEFIPRGGDLSTGRSGCAVPPEPGFILEDTEFVTRHHGPHMAASNIVAFDRGTTNAHGGSRSGLASRPVLGGRQGARDLCAMIADSKNTASSFESRYGLRKDISLQIYEDTQYNLDE
ncbi:hypothetical protein VaNZ11_011435 [Volvox africanus]|uniref:BUB1 N-terminal domain-containing protein n=1 Tax=Volvox africanus TaxID=51714 RepID=A0ABQ5SCP1_9CHLO|nr:hypothetical protein VaNZ11_011435 [Volvox africanus]